MAHTKFLQYLLTATCTAAVSHAAYAEPMDYNYFSLGLEGFHETYEEPGPDVNITANYGSITGKWVHTWRSDPAYFTALDGRYSIGSDNYSSSSGTFSGAKETETDDRIRVGLNSWGAYAPYIGLGIRYFVDNGKGEVTDLGAMGYDRRITQFYSPIGISYTYVTEAGWSIIPEIEVDPLLYGNVNSRLGTIPGLFNIDNTQKPFSGYGLRGEIMAGWHSDNHKLEFQAGPFVRYWHVNDSQTTTDPVGNVWIEPHNERTQYGLALRMMW